MQKRKERVGKQAMIAAIKAAGLNKADATTAYETMLNTMTSALAQDKVVALSGIGSIDSQVKRARMGRKPGTGEAIEIPERTRFRLRPTKK